MKKVNTTYWKQFRVGEFFDFQRGKVKKLQSLTKGDVPVIAAARNKQGVAGYYAVEPIYKDQITISCNGVGCGSTFYHDYPFNVNGDAIVSFDKIYISGKAKQFISCVLDGILTRKYSYEEKCSPEKASNEEILLPVTPEGKPNWQFMEDYMRCIEQRAKTAISAFVSSKYTPHKIDNTYWKEFVIDDLFEKLELKFKPKKFIKTKHVSIERTEEFNIPLVNAKHSNNGIMYYGRESDFESEEMTIDIVADGAASTGDVYPQPQRTGVLYNAYLIKLKNRKSSKAVLCFLSTVIERCVKQKFGYDNKCTWDKVKKEKILLPTSPAGEPDWHYMEMYMRGVEAIAKEKISLLTSKKQEPIQQTNLVNYGTVNIYEK